MEAIWLISGGPLQGIAAKKIKSLGYTLILSDGAENPICRPLSDYFLHVDTFNIEGHIAAARELRERFTIRAVLTSGADCHQTVAAVADFLDLHHTPMAISELCRNKHSTRQRLASAGLRQPHAYLCRSYQQACKAAVTLGGSFVLKATDNSASRGFAAFDGVNGFSESLFNYTLKMGTSGAVIIEERLSPSDAEISEASVETLWIDGKMRWINWVDRIFPCDLKFFPELAKSAHLQSGIELGHINPASHSAAIFEQTYSSVQRAGEALGMSGLSGAHILKADIYFSTDGPIILEMTPRTSGGWDSSASSPARGADIVGGLIQVSLGVAIGDAEWDRHFTFLDPSRVVAVVSKASADARDCTGRIFAMDSGYGDRRSIVIGAYNKLEKGDTLVPFQ
jgi:biotin carboxylase